MNRTTKKEHIKNFKAIFHVNDEKRINIAIGNIVNLMKDISPQIPDVELLINGPAIILFKKKAILKQLLTLHRQGIRIVACRNSINMYCKNNPDCPIAEDRLPTFIKVVSAGVSEIIIKQNMGYAYIKP
jgi:intracellular sulfur oxidation DsrE/DsrF family protein